MVDSTELSSAVDADRFRDGMRHLCTGVTIIATGLPADDGFGPSFEDLLEETLAVDEGTEGIESEPEIELPGFLQRFKRRRD